MEPFFTGIRPIKDLRSVVFPAPLLPINVVILPGINEQDTDFNIG
jgi:hypothetical protein